MPGSPIGTPGIRTIADYVIVSDYYDGERLAPRPPISSIPAAPPAHASASQERLGVLSASETRHLPGKAPLVLAAYTTTPVRPVSFVRKLAVFEPIEVGEKLCLGFAEELNRRSDGIHAAPLRVAPVSASHGPADLGRMASSLSHRVTSLMVRWSKLAAAAPPRMAGPLPPPKPINPLMVFENLYGGVAPGRTIIEGSEGEARYPQGGCRPGQARRTGRDRPAEGAGRRSPAGRHGGRWIWDDGDQPEPLLLRRVDASRETGAHRPGGINASTRSQAGTPIRPEGRGRRGGQGNGGAGQPQADRCRHGSSGKRRPGHRSRWSTPSPRRRFQCDLR